MLQISRFQRCESFIKKNLQVFLFKYIYNAEYGKACPEITETCKDDVK